MSPSADIISNRGQSEAKKLLKCGLPVIEGSEGGVKFSEAKSVYKQIGYQILIKHQEEEEVKV